MQSNRYLKIESTTLDVLLTFSLSKFVTSCAAPHRHVVLMRSIDVKRQDGVEYHQKSLQVEIVEHIHKPTVSSPVRGHPYVVASGSGIPKEGCFCIVFCASRCVLPTRTGKRGVREGGQERHEMHGVEFGCGGWWCGICGAAVWVGVR